MLPLKDCSQIKLIKALLELYFPPNNLQVYRLYRWQNFLANVSYLKHELPKRWIYPIALWLRHATATFKWDLLFGEVLTGLWLLNSSIMAAILKQGIQSVLNLFRRPSSM
ncbi:Hypothetical predicted protein [Podarcis lilfordi]|uniref:Uncharacterized protein n=1 Tax=Podarcis lilfordi TaxID=74358 RepID=A0AA35JUV0_9SAUR|nr:Hypothetical predicted protein [Podarcis lilfordi]